MAWIKVVRPEDDENVVKAMAGQRHLYPAEYDEPVRSLEESLPGIVLSHSLIPDALFHAFSTFGSLMSPDLPLDRRRHELIATVVSLTNECRY